MGNCFLDTQNHLVGYLGPKGKIDFNPTITIRFYGNILLAIKLIHYCNKV